MAGVQAQRVYSRQWYSYMIAVQFLLVSVGAVTLFSASWYNGFANKGNAFHYWNRQMVWTGLGVLLAVGITFMDERWIRRAVPAFVVLTLLLNGLTYLPGMGFSTGGARRWIAVGGYTFQPSELTKVALVLYLARMLNKNEKNLGNFRESLLHPFLMVALLVSLVFFQNDFSTAAFLLLMAMFMFVAAGVPWRSVAAVSGTVAGGAVLMVLWAPYRLERVRSWLHPGDDPSRSGYQILRSRMALERGGLWGKGLGMGAMKRGSLPQAHSDFVGAVIGEEAGLFGILAVLGLFTLFALLGWRSALKTSDVFARWVIFGLVGAVYWQVLVNMSVVCGMAPATGIPLPFFSVGGSSALITLVMFGLINRFMKDGER